MIVGICGYTGSGSSAVSDYLKEFNSTQVIDNFEFTLLHSPDGLEDLDYQLNEQCSKYTASSIALYRFERCVYNYLIRLVKDKSEKRKLKQITEDYIDSLTQVKWKGSGVADLQLYKSKFSMMPFLNATRILRKWPWRLGTEWLTYPSRTMRLSICPKDFDIITRKYLKDVLVILGADFSKLLVVDQLFAGNNPEKGFKYFDDPYAIIVDRDPRDMYLFAKEFYHRKGFIYQIPTDTVDNFIKYYASMRKNCQTDHLEHILRVQFEDMVYQYEKTTEMICDFCHLDKSKKKETAQFEPQKSIRNTQIFRRFTQYSSDIKKIENELSEYLYPFEQGNSMLENGEMFDRASGH